MEDPTTSQHIHLHFVNWQQQQEILEQNVFWVKVVLAEFIKGDWRAQIRLWLSSNLIVTAYKGIGNS